MKPKLVTGPPTKKTEGDADGVMPFDQNRVLDAEMSSNRLAIVIPVTIVAVWLIILVVIATVLCCQRRRTHHSLRTMYGPAYQIRPIATSFTMRDPNAIATKHYEPGGGLYDDHHHLEKAARLSGEMGNFNNVVR
jgi:hypothetical protein